MTYLFVLNETFTNGLNYGIIDFISLTSILCGILVIISKNPIVSVLSLLGSSLASYIIAGAESAIGLGILVEFFRLRGSFSYYINICQL